MHSCYFLTFHLTHSYRVLSRLSTHWSQLVSDGNPRGYNEKQKQKIADADTLMKKWAVERNVMTGRLARERKLKDPIDDEYGMNRINAMIADIEAEYAAKMGIAGSDDVNEKEDGDISEGF
jgi:hypothetical protein